MTAPQRSPQRRFKMAAGAKACALLWSNRCASSRTRSISRRSQLLRRVVDWRAGRSYRAAHGLSRPSVCQAELWRLQCRSTVSVGHRQADGASRALGATYVCAASTVESVHHHKGLLSQMPTSLPRLPVQTISSVCDAYRFVPLRLYPWRLYPCLIILYISAAHMACAHMCGCGLNGCELSMSYTYWL